MRIRAMLAMMFWAGLTWPAAAQTPPAVGRSCDPEQIEANKRLAAAFYRDLWFTDNTERYADYVAPTYVVHDVGEKGVREPAIKQKNIADFFHDNASMTGEIDFQVANCDRVATRWRAISEPETLLGRIAIGRMELPIINVLRIEDGKIVEFWNHRHDIVTRQTLRFVAQGLAIGLLIAFIPLIWALRLRRRLKRREGQMPQ